MGRPKALLVLGGETMLERQVGLLRSVAHEVFVVGWPASLPTLSALKDLRGVRCLSDDWCGRGPLGGIYTGLKRTRTEYNLFVGCDMPFIEADFLRYLCRRAFKSRADVTVPKSHEGWLNPLCAVYRPRTLDEIRESLEAGENKITRWFARVRCDVVPWREIACAGFASTVFDNMNTLKEYEAAKEKLSVIRRHCPLKT